MSVYPRLNARSLVELELEERLEGMSNMELANFYDNINPDAVEIDILDDEMLDAELMNSEEVEEVEETTVIPSDTEGEDGEKLL